VGGRIFTNIFFVFGHFGVTLPVEKADKVNPFLAHRLLSGNSVSQINQNYFQVSQTVSLEIDV
jgi:hypothetical protein